MLRIFAKSCDASFVNCPHTKDCPLFEQFRMESALRVWQMGYCESDYSRCARHKMVCSGADVPPNMLPNGKLIKLRTSKDAG